MGGIIMYFLELFAEAQGMLGNYAEQRIVLDEAVTIMNRIQDTHFKAEIYRLMGENILHNSSDRNAAKDWLRRAQ